jgi:PBSX family phage terminase large subunit
MRSASFQFHPFSDKQLQLLRWWKDKSPYSDYDGVIADGAIRSGKTLAMSLSFIMWAMHTFEAQQFGLCGKSIGSLRRNVINWLVRILPMLGYHVREKRAENSLVVTWQGKVNYFYMFGGKDESSQDMIQGISLAGVLLDEAVLMPESFINQATGRCSVEGAKLWFSCNPANRMHHFKLNWINQYKKKRLLYLHFTMDDNLSLSERTKRRYRNMYTGMFYRRYVLGEWVSADGIIYDMWTDENLYTDADVKNLNFGHMRRYVACDYGTTNPTVFLDVYDDGDVFRVANEYYFDSRARQRQKTDGEYAADFERFVNNDKSVSVILDPSAESFRVELKNRGYHVVLADNAVLDGIRVTSTMIRRRKLLVNRDRCPNFIREIDGYVWDDKAAQRGEERPIKTADHAMDAIRYLLKTTVRNWRLSD